MAEFLPNEFIVKHGAASYNEDKSKWVIDIEPKEEIVRCDDCKFCVKRGYRLYCDLNTGGFPEVESDGFCAWGERKNNVMSN